MSKPQLTVFAGCNGSGKSSFSYSFVPSSITVFDFDKEKRKELDAITFDFEFSEELAHQKTLDLFESLVKESIRHKTDFAYETNFNYNPLKWPQLFKEAGYTTNLVFFTLSNVPKAKERVAIRVENGGHFVSDFEIKNRFTQGYKNLDSHFNEFDQVLVFDTSIDGKLPRRICFINDKDLEIHNSLPEHMLKNTPKLYKWIQERLQRK